MSNTNNTSQNDLIQQTNVLSAHLKSEKINYYIQGGLFILLGLIALILPTFMAISFNFLLAILLIMAGGMRAFTIRKNFSVKYLFGTIIILVLGILMFLNPFQGAAAISILLGIYFFVEGLLEVFFAMDCWSFYRSFLLIASGVFALILSMIIFFGYMSLSITILGLVLGINFIFFGLSLIFLIRSLQDF